MNHFELRKRVLVFGSASLLKLGQMIYDWYVYIRGTEKFATEEFAIEN